MTWEKKGRILEPDARLDWLTGAAGNCWASEQADGRIRLIVSGRDAMNRSRLGEVWLNGSNHQVLQVSPHPLIDLGELGVFDYNGTAYPWLVADDTGEYLYYTGWTVGHHVAFINDLGLAIRPVGKSQFSKYSRAGIFPRTDAEPFGTGSVCVLKEANEWKMWYTTFVRWGHQPGDQLHYYHIRFARSTDGIHWERPGTVCVDYREADGEYVTARPCVIRYRGLYLMWFSYRGPHYRMGFAVSRDGENWTRHDSHLSLDVSESGWDSEMVSYGMVIQRGEQLEMYYTGNGFGRSGLGLAVMNTAELDITLTRLGYL